jgi:hypothetical protein
MVGGEGWGGSDDSDECRPAGKLGGEWWVARGVCVRSECLLPSSHFHPFPLSSPGPPPPASSLSPILFSETLRMICRRCVSNPSHCPCIVGGGAGWQGGCHSLSSATEAGLVPEVRGHLA